MFRSLLFVVWKYLSQIFWIFVVVRRYLKQRCSYEGARTGWLQLYAEAEIATDPVQGFDEKIS